MTIWLQTGRERKKKPNDKVYIYSIWPKNTSCLFWLRFLRGNTHGASLRNVHSALQEKKLNRHMWPQKRICGKKKSYHHKIESFQLLLTGLIQCCLQICGIWFKCKNRRTNMKPCEEQGRHKKNYSVRTTILCLTDSVSPWILCFRAAIYSCQLFQYVSKKEGRGGTISLTNVNVHVAVLPCLFIALFIVGTLDIYG